MNTTTKTIIAATLILLMSSTATALIEPDWPMDKPNEKLQPSDLFIDFEDGIQNEWPIPNSTGVRFLAYKGFPWVYAEKDFAYMNIFPDCRNPESSYVVNGGFGAFTCWMRIPYHTGVIQFDSGATYVSVLASTSCYLRMSAYDKTGKFIESSGTAEPNVGTLTFTRMAVSSSKPDIQTIIITGLGNHWIIDDLVISGQTFPDPPKDYKYASERMKQLIGANFLEYGLGYDLVMGQFLTAGQIKDEIADPCWNPETKELFFGIGIYDENAIVWAFNVDEDVVNWGDINNQAKHDFTVHVEYGEQRPGDVFFLDYDADSCYDEVGIFIEPQHNPETGALEDIIRIIPEAGVHYESSEYIHALYGVDTGTTIDSFMDCRRLPDHPKGGHSPYPKVPSKFLI